MVVDTSPIQRIPLSGVSFAVAPSERVFEVVEGVIVGVSLVERKTF